MTDADARTGTVSRARRRGEVVELVTFDLGTSEYGLDIVRSREILLPQAITRVPRAEDHVLGVINLRGKIVAVLDPLRMLGKDPGEPGEERRIIVCDGPEETVVGLRVDRVRGILRVDPRMVGPAPEAITGAERGVVRGVARVEKRVVALLDLDRFLGGVLPEEDDEEKEAARDGPS